VVLVFIFVSFKDNTEKIAKTGFSKGHAFVGCPFAWLIMILAGMFFAFQQIFDHF